MAEFSRHTTKSGEGAFICCLHHWRIYAIVSCVALLLALVIAHSIPKEYSSQIKLADESKEVDLLIGLNSYAAWARGAIDDNRGIRHPEVYYQLVSTREFAEEMSQVKVENYETDYLHYLEEHHRKPWWESLFTWLKSETDPKEEIIDIIQSNIRSQVSPRYYTVVIQVSDQDPLVAAMMVDSVKSHLQKRLANEARLRAFRELVNVREEMEDAEKRYKAAQEAYTRFSDSNNDLSSPRAMSMEDHLLKEYEIAFSKYNKECEQYRRTKAFVDRFTYSFAVVQNATTALKPSRPATTGYVLSFLVMGIIFTTWSILLREKFATNKC